MEIFQKRGRWCVRKNGKLFKFKDEKRAREFYGEEETWPEKEESTAQKEID